MWYGPIEPYPLLSSYPLKLPLGSELCDMPLLEKLIDMLDCWDPLGGGVAAGVEATDCEVLNDAM